MNLKYYKAACYVVTLIIFATAQVWTNVTSFQSASNMFNQLRVDRKGVFYGAGSYYDSLALSTGAYCTSRGEDDCLVFRADTSCVPELLYSFGGTGIDEIGDMVLRDNGNIIVTGQFQHAMSIGTTVLEAPATESFFTVEFAGDSTPVWTAVNNCYKGSGLTILANGSVAVTGIMLAAGATILPGEMLRSHGEQDLFVALYDKYGMPKWATSAGSKVDDALPVVTSFGNSVYWCGHFYDTLHIDTSGETIDASSTDMQAFLIKLDELGELVWKKKFASTGRSVVNSLLCDSLGNLYATGTYSGTLQLEGTSVTSSNEFSMFIAKLTSEGTAEWIRSVDLATGTCLTLRSNEEVILAGSFRREMAIDTFSLLARDIEDVFVAGIAPNGKCTWILNGGCCRAACIKTVAVHKNNILVCGTVDRVLVGACTIDFSGLVIQFDNESLGRTFFAAMDPGRSAGVKKPGMMHTTRFTVSQRASGRFYDCSGRDITRTVRVLNNGALQRNGSAGLIISQCIGGAGSQVVLSR